MAESTVHRQFLENELENKLNKALMDPTLEPEQQVNAHVGAISNVGRDKRANSIHLSAIPSIPSTRVRLKQNDETFVIV